ncbi:MAG: hypothetical protein KA184_16660 [Candidatus Hydrogenedentes bacterium]|nr:hypothetical protein [Candidatus Hydrogenedentota bacterium]
MSSSTTVIANGNGHESRDHVPGADLSSPAVLERVTRFELRGGTRRLMLALLGLGLAGFVIGLVFAPSRAWASLLLVSQYFVGLSLAGLFLVAVLYVSGAGWGVAIRRIPESLALLLPLGLAGTFLVLLAGRTLYPWTTLEGEVAYAGFKGLWLNYGFWLLRAGVYAALWLGFAGVLLRHSREQDFDGEIWHTHRNARVSAAFLVVFALTCWLSSVDWVMSLEPDWYSTIFGVYNFSGQFCSGLACTIIVVAWLRGRGALSGIVTDEHFHDLGKLLLGFTTFWAYIWFSQYMLIWYANIPEETSYYIPRVQGTWGPLFLLNVGLNWVAPFFALLPRGGKRNAYVLTRVAVVVLAGRWLDLYLMIYPSLSPAGPSLGPVELLLSLGGAGLFVLWLGRVLQRSALVPLRDPYLQESLGYHQ